MGLNLELLFPEVYQVKIFSGRVNHVSFDFQAQPLTLSKKQLYFQVS